MPRRFSYHPRAGLCHVLRSTHAKGSLSSWPERPKENGDSNRTVSSFRALELPIRTRRERITPSWRLCGKTATPLLACTGCQLQLQYQSPHVRLKIASLLEIRFWRWTRTV